MRFLVPTLLLALPSASAAFAQCPNDDPLGNNTIATGWPLQPGASVLDAVVFGTGTVNPMVPDPGNDIFLFTLEPGQSVDFDTVFDFSQVALYIQIYVASSNSLIAGTNPNTQTAFLSYTNPNATATAYYLHVRSAQSPSGCGDYTLETRLDACPGDDTLENFDDCGNTYSLTDPGMIELQRLAVTDNDDDWFDVRLLPDETLDVSIFFEHARADVDLYLYDLTTGSCGANFLDRGFSATDDEFVTHTNTTGTIQDIAIQVDWYDTVGGDTCNDYELAYEVMGGIPDDIFEDNDTVCTPAQPGIGVFPNLVVTDFDSDFYVLELQDDRRGRFSIDFDNALGDLDLRLWEYNGCGTEFVIDSSTSVSNYEEVEATHSGPGGVYILEVYYYPSDGGSNSYELTIGEGYAFDTGETVCFGEGNSTGSAAETTGLGSLSVASNQFALNTTSLPTNSFGFYNASRGFGIVANPGGSSGNLCLAGAPIGRFVGPGQIVNSGSPGEVSLSIDLTAMPQPTGFVQAVPGETWFFQLWYRDSDPSGNPTSNFSSTVRARFE